MFAGLDFIHKITSTSPQELLVEMEDFDGNKVSARYSSFSVGPECEGYKLEVSGFTDGGAGEFTKSFVLYYGVNNNTMVSMFLQEIV